MTGLILYTTEDGQNRIQHRAKDQTVWLSQREMGQLFDVSTDNVRLHLKNIFEDGELDQAATVKESLTVQTEGKSSVSGHASVDQFRDSTKMIVCGKMWPSDHFRGATKMVWPEKKGGAIMKVVNPSQFVNYQSEDGRTKQNNGQHLKNIFSEQMLGEESVVKDFFTTAADGK